MKLSNKLVIFGVTLSLSMPLLAGNLNSPAAPDNTGSAMYTIEDIYNRLNDGTADAKRTTPFKEPSAGPTTGTGKTLNDVMGKAPVKDDTNGAATTDVLKNKTFWGLTNGEWGLQTGAGDDDLTAGNIKKDVVIFGVTGSYEGSGGTYNAAVGKTGQTKCYNASAEITCGDASFPGQDGDHQKGATTATRFTALNGTVTDNLTGLIWLQKANCINSDYSSFDTDGTSGDGKVTWEHALIFVKGINDNTYPNCGASQTDWRLPNVKELQSLIDFSNTGPALPSSHPFTGVQTYYYWSSTTYATNTTRAWFVGLVNGYVNDGNKANTYYIWPVRGGQ